jgi:hypothetical protein
MVIRSYWPDHAERAATESGVRSAPALQPRAPRDDRSSAEQSSAADEAATELPFADEPPHEAEALAPPADEVVLAHDRPVLTADAFLQQPPIKALLEEPRDPKWSAETERRILGEIAEWKGIPFLRLDVECRTSFCMVSVAHPPGTDVRQPFRDAEWLLHALNMGPRPFYMGKGPGDTIEGLLFLGRVTAPPPAPPAQ